MSACRRVPFCRLDLALGYLDAVRERVVIFDGATGHEPAAAGLTADDFGGPGARGLQRVLVATRPDVIGDLHRSFFDVGVDVVETDSFGALPWSWPSTGSPSGPASSNVAAAEIARRVADDIDAGPAPLGGRELGPGTKLASLGQIGFDDLRDAYEEPARGLLEGGVDLLHDRDRLRPPAGQGGRHRGRRAMAATADGSRSRSRSRSS